MAQPLDHATFQLYQSSHRQVYASRDTLTYDHFSISRSADVRQAELLTSYLQSMIDALFSDLNQRGDCWLLRAIVSHELPAIHLLDHSAIAYVYATLFTPEETPLLNGRSIPYSGAFSYSPGGMLYTDRRARTCVIDLRGNGTLHLLCHALLMYADRQTLVQKVQRLESEKNALGSRITQLSDHILGLERELAARPQAEMGTYEN